MKRTIAAASSAIFSGFVALVLFVAGLQFGADVEAYLNPVVTNWKVTDWIIEGNDVLVTGHMIKRRSCKYHPPPAARDAFGVNYLVHSEAKSAGVSWTADDRPQKFGPWRVYGGAHKALEFYVEYQCHAMWPQLVELGLFAPRD